MSDIGFVKRSQYPGYSERKVEAILLNLTDKEVEELFYKFETHELHLLDELFDELQEYIIRDRIIIEKDVETKNGKIKQKVNIIKQIIKERKEEERKGLCVSVSPSNYDYTDLQERNSALNNKELEFIDAAVSSLVKYLEDSNEIEEEAIAHGFQLMGTVNTDTLDCLEVYKESLTSEIKKRVKKLSLTLGV